MELNLILIFSFSAMMPPGNNKDFDLHLERTMEDLNGWQDDKSLDVFVLYCPEDFDSNSKITPKRLKRDLEQQNFSV